MYQRRFSDFEFYVLRRLYARSSGFSTEVYVKIEFSELLVNKAEMFRKAISAYTESTGLNFIRL
jgi:hypothetical protein